MPPAIGLSSSRLTVNQAFRKLVGTSDDALMIACTALTSTLVYFAASSYLRLELNAVSYRLLLFRSYYDKFGWPDLFPASVSGVGVIQLAILGTVCAIFGLLVRWLFYPGSGGGLVALVYGFAAALVPPLLLAAALWPDGQGRLGTSALLALSGGLIGVLAVAFIRRSRARAKEIAQIETTMEVEHSRFRFLVLVPLLPLMVLVWWCGVSALQGFDSWSYHVPIAAHWLTDSSLYRGPEVSLTDFYPGNFELLVRWLLVLGSPHYVFVVALIGGLLSVYTIYRICLELEHTRTAALIAAACAGTCVVLVNLMATAYSDTIASLFTLVAVFFLLRWLRTREPALLAALGTSLGLAAGTKYTALPVAVLIVATVAWHLLPSVKTESNIAPIKGLAVLLLPFIICAGYWYIRNAIEHGNPVFPVGMVGLPGVRMDYLVPPKPGLPAAPLHYVFLPWREFGFNGTYYDDGIGLTFAAIALPAFILMPMLDSWRSRRPAVILWLITIALFAHWLSTGSLYARFGLFPILLTFVWIGEAWSRFGSPLLKALTLACYAVTVAILAIQVGATAAYSELMPPGRKGVPAVVDQLPAARILNAVNAELTLPLLGRDYRHYVTTYFRSPLPEDVIESKAEYVLLTRKQEADFSRALTLSAVATDSSIVYGGITLWKVNRTGQLKTSERILQSSPYPVMTSPK